MFASETGWLRLALAARGRERSCKQGVFASLRPSSPASFGGACSRSGSRRLRGAELKKEGRGRGHESELSQERSWITFEAVDASLLERRVKFGEEAVELRHQGGGQGWEGSTLRTVGFVNREPDSGYGAEAGGLHMTAGGTGGWVTEGRRACR